MVKEHKIKACDINTFLQEQTKQTKAEEAKILETDNNASTTHFTHFVTTIICGRL